MLVNVVYSIIHTELICLSISLLLPNQPNTQSYCRRQFNVYVTYVLAFCIATEAIHFDSFLCKRISVETGFGWFGICLSIRFGCTRFSSKYAPLAQTHTHTPHAHAHNRWTCVPCAVSRYTCHDVHSIITILGLCTYFVAEIVENL